MTVEHLAPEPGDRHPNRLRVRLPCGLDVVLWTTPPNAAYIWVVDPTLRAGQQVVSCVGADARWQPDYIAFELWRTVTRKTAGAKMSDIEEAVGLILAAWELVKP